MASKSFATDSTPIHDTLQSKLTSLELSVNNIDYIINHGKNFVGKPELLAKKLKIPKEKAISALEAITSPTLKPVIKVTQAQSEIIDSFLKDNPCSEINLIVLVCEIEEDIVAAHLGNRPLNDKQIATIKEKYNTGCSIEDIVNITKLPEEKVSEYLIENLLTFCGEEGKACWKIVQDQGIPDVSSSNIRGKILSDDIKLKDQLCCQLKQNNEQEYTRLRQYLEHFSESKHFCEVDMDLTMDNIAVIKQSGLENIDQISAKLHKVETVVRNYLTQYHPNKIEEHYQTTLQSDRIKYLLATFGEDELNFHAYKMIISDSFEILIKEAEAKDQEPRDVFKKLLPLAFYYIKCSLPLDTITTIIANTCNITLTTHEVFHIIFQLSDPVLRGFTIEHYSFSNPIPLYYPNIDVSCSKETGSNLEICKELWYSLQPVNGVVSFGIGSAGWNPIGKSYLLDFIFGTNFVEGNSQKSAFHHKSIDIQMTKNLFGEVKVSNEESIKWAYVDCHGYSDSKIIQAICQQLDIALVHVSFNDYLNNRSVLEAEVLKLTENLKHVYLLIRDYTGAEVKESREANNCSIFIPNLIKGDTNIHAVKKKLKATGYEILHLRDPKQIHSEFLEKVMNNLNHSGLERIQSDKEVIAGITAHIDKVVHASKVIDFTFLNYYPLFVEYMSAYYAASYEIDQKTIDELNKKSGKLITKLESTEMGNIVVNFNKIIERENSTLILWKLSQELAILSRKVLTKIDGNIQQKNDRYTLEILWREALLSNKYGKLNYKDYEEYSQKFRRNFSNNVERGEAFELIDGDNLRFFNKELNALLSDLYFKQEQELQIINEGKSILMKQAPIVLSIFGPQSSGKSTLLNYSFGCKFLTSAGRCTRGIYGSLSKLSRPVNNSNNFLILDTEGLDAIERGNIKDTSVIHFDRTMVLFCLAVSQVVIINVKGDIGSEMQKLLQICAYSLSKLKVSKVAAPKIFFVLNQQADPDPKKHLDSINILMDKLNKESELIDTDGLKISDLIQVTKENLFILPSAFNSELVNTPNAELFESKVIKLSPTVTFADKCADLRLAIINELDKMSKEERQPFTTMNRWMEMSGVIWDTIIKYQDIVKYNNVEELVCSSKLNKMVSSLMDSHIIQNKPSFQLTKDKLCYEIKEIETLCHPETILTQKMLKFDEGFDTHQTDCIKEYDKQCQEDQQLRKMDILRNNSKTNLSRLIYRERQYYEDEIKFQIKSIFTEIKLSESMKKFQDAIVSKVDHYLTLDNDKQEESFKEIWRECFGYSDGKEEELERDGIFKGLYSTFKLDSNTMDNQPDIYERFREKTFDMDKIIRDLKDEISRKFKDPKYQFIFSSCINNTPIKDMTPYAENSEYLYLDKDSLFVVVHKKEKSNTPIIGGFIDKYNDYRHPTEIQMFKWIPEDCHPIVKHCSGHYNHPDIHFRDLDRNSQTLLLASKLICPSDSRMSTWEKLINDVTLIIVDFVKKDENMRAGTVREIIHHLCRLLNVVNYEINFIEAKLSNTAERTISTYVFAHAFKSIWGTKKKKRSESNEKEKEKKTDLHQYFFEKIQTRKLIRGTLCRNGMKDRDRNMSRKFAKDFIAVLQRGVLTAEQSNITEFFEGKKEILSHKRLLLSANDKITVELNDTEKKTIDSNNFVIQYMCNRNQVIKVLFHDQWQTLEDQLYTSTFSNLKNTFKEQIDSFLTVLKLLSKDLKEKCKAAAHSEENAFDSDSNFEIFDLKACKSDDEKTMGKIKESPFKAMTKYLELYLNPRISPDQFEKYFSELFEIDGIMMKPSDTYILCEKRTEPLLNEDTFKKLNFTKMFNSENIFNLNEYITQYILILKDQSFEMPRHQFTEHIKEKKERYEGDAIGCPAQCPSCGKLCERELHPNNGKCQIMTGHQICSMGGKVWNDDDKHTAVLFMCDDYKDDTRVNLVRNSVNWGDFKVKFGNEWNWDLPTDKEFEILQMNNREKMKNIWDKFGEAILKYYLETNKVRIEYVPYVSTDHVYKTLTSVNYNICFVIDGTSSMDREIAKARISVGQFIDKYRKIGSETEFKVIIYRDHCDDVMIEQFPTSRNFTTQHKTVEQFLENVRAKGGGDYPEAVLDGLAQAATGCNWENKLGRRNIIIHIFDAPPHGDFPNYTSHDKNSKKEYCCCCNHGTKCNFDWEKDVWSILRKFNIQYHGIITSRHFSGFEESMTKNLSALCGEFQVVGKEQVNDAILQIFIAL